MLKFVHLHVHSHYSLLDGLSKIGDLVNRVKELGMDAVALTDHGAMYGVIEFYQKAKKAGVKPIIGQEFYITAGSLHDKRAKIDDQRYHLTALARNNAGYKNLMKLSTLAHLEGFYYKPRIDRPTLAKHAEGLIAFSGCLNGEIPKALLAGDWVRAKKLAEEYRGIFGRENFFLEIQRHKNLKEQDTVNEGLLKLSYELGIGLVATCDSHYLKKEDAETQDVLVCIQTNQNLAKEERLTMKDNDFSLKSSEEMIKLFADLPEAIENTERIAYMCNVEIELGKIQLPHFTVPAGEDANSYLRKLCEAGLERRYGIGVRVTDKKIGGKEEEIVQRLNYELGVIEQTGFAPYFLIVQDFVNWAKNQGIVVGPGRGSAAGSIVSYLLNITNIDPITYNLLFERFLNPERISLPDIDLDFADTRRDEVLVYVTEKYGTDHVAQIITFGTMAARAAIRDAGRALGYAYGFCDRLAKLILPMKTFKETLEMVEELRQLSATDPEVKRLLDVAQKLEGVARHASTHACGVVIADKPLTESVPLQLATSAGEGGQSLKKTIVTQYEMHAIEDIGLLKMDFLGLKNLTIIEETLKLVKRHHDIEIDIDKIPLDDKTTLTLFRDARTTGVFQFESAGMKRYMKEIKPTELEDLIALVSLFRPGPMELIPSYINRKHGREHITYLHPKLEPVLQNTYGIGVYQEQMMQIARDLAGFSLAEADTLRKAIGKKIKSLLDQQQEKLVSGMVKNGIDQKTAEAIWELFPPFARYGFNRCVSGDTRIMDPESGRLVAIRALHEKQARISGIYSLASTLKIGKRPVTNVYHNGKKPVWRVTTRSGRIITATHNHPFLTPKGWQELREIDRGTKIAVPRVLPEPLKPIRLKKHQLGLLGYTLAEGNFCHPHGFYFYSKSEEEIQDYLQHLEAFSNTMGKIDRSKPAVAVYTKRRNLRKISGAVAWIETLGLKYKKATEKFFPDIVFGLANKDLALLIGKMFQGDGCINTKRKDPQIFYATSSWEIARGLQHLLLRFNILSTVHTKKFKYRGGVKIGYTVTINRHDNIRKFISAFSPYFVGQKAGAAKEILVTHPILNGAVRTWAARGSYDTVPVAYIQHDIRNAIRFRNLSFAEFARATGVSERLFLVDKKKVGYLRETLAIIAEQLPEEKLHAAAHSDIFWDEISAIEPCGIEDTYDLTVDETHNFVANDIILHNSHGACYALIGYQTGYLKAHYPAEFVAALMNSEYGDVERIAVLVDEAKDMQMLVLPPDINESREKFSVVVDAGENGTRYPAEKVPGTVFPETVHLHPIRFGLSAIKNVGDTVVAAIVAERDRNGEFATLQNFLDRVDSKDLNKKSLEALIKGGALDRFREDRGVLLASVENMLRYVREVKKVNESQQGSLFGMGLAAIPFTLKLEKAEPVAKKDRLMWEKELLGLYVSQHPLEDFREILKTYTAPLRDMEKFTGKMITIGGMLTRLKKIITKTGKPMYFGEMEDHTGRAEVVLFPTVLEQYGELLREDALVLMKGRVDRRKPNGNGNGSGNGGDGGSAASANSKFADTPKFICEAVKELTMDPMQK